MGQKSSPAAGFPGQLTPGWNTAPGLGAADPRSGDSARRPGPPRPTGLRPRGAAEGSPLRRRDGGRRWRSGRGEAARYT